MSLAPITTVAEMQSVRDHLTGSVGLVPTMGYLHEGHLSLIRRALADNDHVFVSIFVNPTQFGPNEDLARYPRDLDRDLQLLDAAHSALETKRSAVVFAPSVEEIYPPDFHDWVTVSGPLTERLEGAHRPSHFRGVTTVVARLFGITRPHRAYFGQKDAQQLRVIRRMVEDQGLDVDVIPMPTVREPDGLALSSRNVYLSPEEREAALAIPRAFALARRMVMDEGISDAELARQAVRASVETPRRGLSAPRLAVDYVSVADEQTLEELEIIDRPALVLIAARDGSTRLIDNTIVVPKGTPIPPQLAELVHADDLALRSLI
jgi:pantoate--beta-alanine ligase